MSMNPEYFFRNVVCRAVSDCVAKASVSSLSKRTISTGLIETESLCRQPIQNKIRNKRRYVEQLLIFIAFPFLVTGFL